MTNDSANPDLPGAPEDASQEAAPRDAADETAQPPRQPQSAQENTGQQAPQKPRDVRAASGPGRSPKLKIGSRRDRSGPKTSKPQVAGADKPVNLQPLEKPPMPPTPSRRDPLPPELEQELEEALGGFSFDQAISEKQVAEAGASLELESRHTATVARVHGDDVFFTLGERHEGVASLRQFAEPPEPGERHEVVVAGLNADDGLYELTVPGAAIEVGDWSDVVEGATVEARVTGANSGGLECAVNALRGFIPTSQVALYRVEDFAEFVDQKLLCIVTEVNAERQNLVLSRRAVLEREKEESRQQLLEELEVGQTREGVVRSLRDFGAFVDLGGIDGLVHVSQLSWERVKHPSEVLAEGDKVKVRIEKIDRQTGKIGLSYRDLLENPWSTAQRDFPVGTVASGVVSRIADFGAFVKLGPGVEGLVHVSELSHKRVHSVGAVVSEGQEVEVKVLSVDPEAQRISLSMKASLGAAKSSDSDPSSEAAEESSQPPPEPIVPKRTAPLRGGTNRPSGGDKFGLKW